MEPLSDQIAYRLAALLVPAVCAAGLLVFAVEWPQSDEPVAEAWSLVFLIPLVA